MKNKYLRKIQIGMFLCAGIFSLFMVSAAFADCVSQTKNGCMANSLNCEWSEASQQCADRTKDSCNNHPMMYWANGACIKGFDPNKTAEGAYQEYEKGDPGSCSQFATPDKCKAPYCKWNSRNQCVDANSDVCDTQGQTACENLNQCKWKEDTCTSRVLGIGEGADEREADCNMKMESDCGTSEMCTWEKDLCRAKSSFLGIGSGKNKEARRLCNEAVDMLNTPNLTAGDQEMYEDQQNMYCGESSYVEPYQGPVFGGPGLKAGAQMSGSYLDASISKERSLPKLAAAWTRFLLQLSAVLAVIAFITAGIFYVTDFGDGTRVESAKKIMMWTTVGILLILGSYAIVNTLMKARFGDTDRGALSFEIVSQLKV